MCEYRNFDIYSVVRSYPKDGSKPFKQIDKQKITFPVGCLPENFHADLSDCELFLEWFENEDEAVNAYNKVGVLVEQ